MPSVVYGPGGYDPLKASGNAIAIWDDASRVYTDVIAGTTRPYTAAENAAADGRTAAETAASNRATLSAGIDQVIADLKSQIDAVNLALASLDTVTAASNSTINASPASYVTTCAKAGKDSLRAAKRTAKAAISLARLVGGRLDTANTGAA